MASDLGGQAGTESLVEVALVAIDAVNALDPVTIEVDGEERPKEVVHAERMTHWLAVLDPEATPAQRLAARAHHLRRWSLPRSDYPEGRAGYLRWRTEQGRRQAEEAGTLLREAGIDAATIDRVKAIVAKKGRTSDPQVQTHEDALCLVFLEQQLDPVAVQLGEERAIDVLRKTIRKMSDQGIAAVSKIPLSESGSRLVAEALRVADLDR